jgi:hypothetical protein
MEGKKSFLLYFDSYPLIATLSPEQRGYLLSAVFQYAMGIEQEPDLEAEEIWRQFPEMHEGTRIACGFLFNAILRDTQKWRSQKEARQRRTQERKGAKPEAISQYVKSLRPEAYDCGPNDSL